jgi:hypothetical protein
VDGVDVPDVDVPDVDVPDVDVPDVDVPDVDVPDVDVPDVDVPDVDVPDVDCVVGSGVVSPVVGVCESVPEAEALKVSVSALAICAESVVLPLLPPPQEASSMVVIPAHDRARNERRVGNALNMKVPLSGRDDLINIKSPCMELL